MVDTLKIHERYFPEEITRQGFIGHMKKYIKELLSDPASAKVDEYLEKYGITSEKALKELLDNCIIIRSEKIKDGHNGKDVFTVKYKVPNADFKKKMRNLYIKLFENHMVDDDKLIKEDGEGAMGGGATSCADVTGGENNQIQVPVFGMVSKKPKQECKKNRSIIITEKQRKYIEEATATSTVGDYTYDAPAFVDAETADHKNIMRKSWRG